MRTFLARCARQSVVHNTKNIAVRIFIKAVDLLSKFPLFVVSVWISPESEVLSNSLFFVANWPMGSRPLSHVIPLTNQRPVTEAEGQGQVQTRYLLFVKNLIVSSFLHKPPLT